MVNDQQLKNLINKVPFFTDNEKEFLLSKLSQLDKEKKQKLAEFLIIEILQFIALNLKYSTMFQNIYLKWQNTFERISRII